MLFNFISKEKIVTSVSASDKLLIILPRSLPLASKPQDDIFILQLNQFFYSLSYHIQIFRLGAVAFLKRGDCLPA